MTAVVVFSEGLWYCGNALSHSCCCSWEGKVAVGKFVKKKSCALSARVHFPDDERRLPWLPMLLDAYAIVDTGVAVALRQKEKREKLKLACRNGCDVCCRQNQKDIPLFPHELVGLYWFVSEKTDRTLRDYLKEQLAVHAAGSPCPFLKDGSCSVHPVRPASCRWFNVFRAPCMPGEDPYYTRRHDVLDPIHEYTDRAFAVVLPFYNIKERSGGGEEAAVKLIRAQIMNLQAYDWKKLIAVMEKVDTKTP
jgi:Fe-S-cluster containining protein